MKRREFLQGTAGAAAGVALATAPGRAAESTGGGEFYEWRTYRLSDDARQSAVSRYLEQACLPAWKRLGVGPVGVFTELGDDPAPNVHVLLTYPSLARFATARAELEQDADYQRAAESHLAAKMASPAFDRIESSLLAAFAGAPHITPPARRPRVLELRTYESHSEERARKKIAMFNDGEIPIFPRCGFENVFFGETLVGQGLPSLTYMIATPDLAASEAAWQRFLADPGFIAMKDDPQYADTVSKITRRYLAPAAFSEI